MQSDGSNDSVWASHWATLPDRRERERCGVRENCSLVGVSLMRTPNIIRFPRRRDCCDDLFRLSTNHQYYSPPATRETPETAHMH